jgi:hypothetical protein
LDRLHGGEQSYGESKDFQEFHEMIEDASGDESRKPAYHQ